MHSWKIEAIYYIKDSEAESLQNSAWNREVDNRTFITEFECRPHSFMKASE